MLFLCFASAAFFAVADIFTCFGCCGFPPFFVGLSWATIAIDCFDGGGAVLWNFFTFPGRAVGVFKTTECFGVGNEQRGVSVVRMTFAAGILRPAVLSVFFFFFFTSSTVAKSIGLCSSGRATTAGDLVVRFTLSLAVRCLMMVRRLFWQSVQVVVYSRIWDSKTEYGLWKKLNLIIDSDLLQRCSLFLDTFSPESDPMATNRSHGFRCVAQGFSLVVSYSKPTVRTGGIDCPAIWCSICGMRSHLRVPCDGRRLSGRRRANWSGSWMNCHKCIDMRNACHTISRMHLHVVRF